MTGVQAVVTLILVTGGVGVVATRRDHSAAVVVAIVAAFAAAIFWILASIGGDGHVG